MSKASVREYAILYAGKAGRAGASSVGGGNVILTAGQHKLDGVEHLAPDDTTTLDATSAKHGLLPKLSGSASDALLGDGTWGAVVPTLPWYDVMVDGSCVGDGVTDDTAALQAAITAATASGTQSATLYFPPGTYLIGGALQDTGAFNGQILLPNVSYTGHAQIQVRFIGAARPPTNLLGDTGPSPSGYTILKSTLTGGSGTAAVFSGGNATNNIHVYIEDLLCIAPDNPSLTFWNLSHTQGGGVRDLLIYSALYWTPPITQPTHSNAYGIKLPQATYSAYTYADGVIVVGYYTGILHGELTLARGYAVGLCIVGVELPAMPHAAKILSYQMTGCTYGIRATGDLACDIDFYDAEHFDNPPHTEGWTVTVYDLDDASNHLAGHIRWWGVEAAVGPDHSFTVNGGANVLSEEIGEAPTAAPSGAAGGDLSGSYPNPSVPHVTDATDAHDASAISFAPTGTIAATDVQAAIVEAAAEAGGTAFVVDPGTPSYAGSPLTVTVTSVFGIDGSGNPYYNAANVTSGEEAALMRDPDTGTYFLRPYNF